LWTTFQADIYRERLGGAFLGRMAGCTLGAPVEFWPIEKMQALAEENGDAFLRRTTGAMSLNPKRKTLRDEFAAGLHPPPIAGVGR